MDAPALPLLNINVLKVPGADTLGPKQQQQSSPRNSAPNLAGRMSYLTPSSTSQPEHIIRIVLEKVNEQDSGMNLLMAPKAQQPLRKSNTNKSGQSKGKISSNSPVRSPARSARGAHH